MRVRFDDRKRAFPFTLLKSMHATCISIEVRMRFHYIDDEKETPEQLAQEYLPAARQQRHEKHSAACISEKAAAWFI